MTQKPCSCEDRPVLVFSCSGAADVGELADRAARRIHKQGLAQMYCLAGLGGSVPGIVKTTKSAKGVLAIDGCSVNCAQKTLIREGIDNFEHLELGSLGFEKGTLKNGDNSVHQVVAHVCDRLEVMR